MASKETNPPSEGPIIFRQRRARAGSEWNINELLQRVDGDREFLRELLSIYREDSQVNLQKAKSALLERDLAGLMRAGHTLKGMLRNLSMNRAGDIAFALETAARRESVQEAEALLEQLEQALAELLPEVEAELAEVKA